MARKKIAADAEAAQNAAKTLYANIRFASVDAPLKSLVITSSVPNEGKTTVTYNLAIAIASSGKRVLLVECDMRRRSMADEIGAHARYGIYAVLSGQVDLSDAVVSTSQPNLYFLDSEPHIPNPPDILSSQRFKRLEATMEATYDYVLFDTPPVGTFVDAAIIATHADATVLVVRENFAKREEVLAAFEQLKKADANIIGAVANMCEADSSDYYYSYYNKDGKRVRKSSHHEPADAPAMPAARGAAANAVPASGGSSARVAQPVSPVSAHRTGTPQTGSRFSRS